jgi:hypothetical protein
VLWVWLVACNEIHLDPVEDTDASALAVVEESFVQRPHAAIDVLFVVDNTPSMEVERAVLVEASSALVDALGELRWHLGVTTTDAVGARAGWLLGSPWVISPTSDAPAAALARAFESATGGDGAEAGFAAALQALELASFGGPNAGFRRDDASLHLVFVSDADDHSDATLGAAPQVSFVAALEAHANRGLAPRVSAIVGGRSGCSGAAGQAVPSPRYLDAVEATGGTFASICDPGYAEILENLAMEAVDWPTRFPLSAVPAGDVEVRVDRAPVDGFVVEQQEGFAELVFAVAPPAGAVIEVSYLVRVGA